MNTPQEHKETIVAHIAAEATAYRCGFSDWLDSERERIWKYCGSYYDRDSVEKALDELEGQTEDEIDDEEKDPGMDEPATSNAEAFLEAIKVFRRTHL